MPLSLMDSAFLVAESREHPTHVALLQLFRPPPDAGPEFVSEFYRSLLGSTDIVALMRRRPVHTLSGLGQWSWVEDDELDMEYHVRHSALPRPGRVRELLALVSRLHGSLLDRHRPLWELHVIEGLSDGRFAVYTKVHHALMDGVSAVNRISAGMSRSPEGSSVPPWAPRGPAKPRTRPADSPVLGQLWERVSDLMRTAGEVAGAPPGLARAMVSTLRDDDATTPFDAPKTIFNVPIGGARRFAAQSWPLERVRAVGKAAPGSAATINDVAVTMCSGALRRYLLDLGELPDRSLVALLPVSLRSAGSGQDSAGNSIGGILCDLATDTDDASVRLARVQASTQHAKTIMSGLNPTQIVALTALLGGGAVAATVPGLRDLVPPAFNLIISNVPGSKEKLYWNGAELLESYPLSVPADGQALNITLTSYDGKLSFGITGCRRTVPHLQRLLDHLESELQALEHAA